MNNKNKFNKYFIVLLVLVSVLFVGCESDISNQANNIVQEDNMNLNEEVENNLNENQSQEIIPKNKNKNLMNESNFNPENMSERDSMEKMSQSQNNDIMFEMVEQVLPDTYQSYVNGEITQDEAIEILNNYLNSLSDEERQALMPTSDMPDKEPMDEFGEMSQR